MLTFVKTTPPSGSIEGDKDSTTVLQGHIDSNLTKSQSWHGPQEACRETTVIRTAFLSPIRTIDLPL